MSRNKEHRPNGAAAEGGRPIGGAAEGGASVFFVSAHLFFYIMNIYGYSLCIPYIFHIFFLAIFHIDSSYSQLFMGMQCTFLRVHGQSFVVTSYKNPFRVGGLGNLCVQPKKNDEATT